jgi:hypothetical protein
VHICSSSECEDDEDYGAIAGSNGTDASDFADYSESAKIGAPETEDQTVLTGIPKTTTFAEIQVLDSPAQVFSIVFMTFFKRFTHLTQFVINFILYFVNFAGNDQHKYLICMYISVDLSMYRAA